MGTKSNPSCYHGAIAYLSNLTGQSKTKEIAIEKAEYLRSRPHPNRHNKNNFKTKLLYKADSIVIQTECGKSISYFPEPNKRFDAYGYVFKCAIVTVNKNVEDFGIKIESCGYYTDCLGGGWTQKVPLFKINDFYFASLECKC